MPGFVVVLTLALAASTAGAQPSFMSIMPPGEDGLVPSSDPGFRGPHVDDQLGMYASLILEPPGLQNADLTRFFKTSTVAPPAMPESVIMPRAGVTISRDAFGVAHVQGVTRNDVFFGAGYVTAQDRLFFADILRHMGRGRMSEFLGGVLGLGGTIGFDRTYYRVAGHSADEIEALVFEGLQRSPEYGPQVLADSEAFRDGMNQYIAEARGDPSKLPAEYSLFGIELKDWDVTDSAASGIAFCTVIGFCNGGGGEHQNVRLLQALVTRHGEKVGEKLYHDLRAGEDKDAPTSTRKKFPYTVVKAQKVDPAANAIFDEDSFSGFDVIDTAASATGAFLWFPQGMSNWLAIVGKRSEGGRPIMVGGPQTGYFAPQPLVEFALEGPGVNVTGMTAAGLPYVVIGHTPDYAFTATAGGSDLVDVYVERLCTPDGGAPDSGTLFDGACVPMIERVDAWSAGSDVVTATVKRTVHGPVVGTATVGGEPVLLARKRTNFGIEVDSGAAFIQVNANELQTPELFRDAMASMNGTLNWVYANREDVAYFHSGRYPIRADGVDPDLPTWGTGEWEWQGILPATDQPYEVNPKQGFMTSWNNKPARLWRSSDSSHGYTSVYRSQMLDVRLKPLVRKKDVTLAQAVEAMADAATCDLRGQEVLPELLAFLKKAKDLAPYVDLLRSWMENGSQRRDRDGDGRYDEEAAVALMDAWWDPLLRAMFDPQLEDLYGLVRVGFHDSPSGGVGSAFQGGYYGTAKKALRQARGRKVKGRYEALRCAGGKKKECMAAVETSLRETVTSLTDRFGSDDPESWTHDATDDQIEFSLSGIAISPPIPWQNRPTFQQAVQIRD